MTRPYNVLFICTGNSARSILAEGLLNHLGGDRFKAFSAGSHPRGEVNPFALRELVALGIAANEFRSKSWDEFAAPGGTPLSFTFTLCDAAAGEACQVWPGQPVTAHWGMPDPASVQGTEEQKAKAFHDAAITLKRRIELMLALPLASLDRLAIHNEVKDIGRA